MSVLDFSVRRQPFERRGVAVLRGYLGRDESIRVLVALATSSHTSRAPKMSTQSSQPFPDTSSSGLSEADIDRFATLFSPATPPATPTSTTAAQSLDLIPRPRKLTQDSDFGAFVSVPPSKDPLSHDLNATWGASPQPHVASPDPSNLTLVYFDQFTSIAKTAAERQRKEVLEELLEHQDDPMYFVHTNATPNPPSSVTHVASIPIPIPTTTDDALAEALASEMSNPKLIRVSRGGSVRVAPSPSRARIPLPPRLSGSASPPSESVSTESATSLPASESPPLPSSSPSISSAHPKNATLSRLSSSFVSMLPSRPRSAAPTPSSAPSTFTWFSPAASSTLTHGSPFASAPYVPPTGAPGFTGDRAWDRGFSEALEQEEKRGLVDPIGLGIAAGTKMAAPVPHAKGKGVTLVGRWEGTARVLTEDMADLIRPHLPALTKLPRHWTLLYSIDQHGISINTLYSRCEPRIPTRAYPNPLKGGLLVIRDARDTLFGAWLSEGVKLEKGGYYGSGESFLWRYQSPLDGAWQGRLEVYPWTGVNEYVALCEPGFISFGGGDGHYGLYVDASLLEGSSAPCPTFGNLPLCVPVPEERSGVVKPKGEVSFECVGLEVWGVGTT